MKTIDGQIIIEEIKKLCQTINYHLPEDVSEQLRQMKDREDSCSARKILEVIEENAYLAADQKVAMCQDTGMVVVFAEIGNTVFIEGEPLEVLINEGVRQGYKSGYLRKSIVNDPLKRTNTEDNTPAVVHQKIVAGNQLKLSVMAKGFGSENMSRLFMLKPYAGKEGVKEMVLKTVEAAGPNPCPPLVIGVGIGGTFDQVGILAKKALLRQLGSKHEDIVYQDLEKEILEAVNDLGIGPQGFGGKTTALGVHIESAPTHIAGLPVAVNLSCHASRHGKVVL